ncbi:hypothetical protein OZ664_11840 [Elizabethkingia sp. HX WHF]|uniref:hypothetical protein n=1 Tax=Elizabethkingia sp. HX WHF TaxID=3003190 RepID=UPI002A23F07D|nr:hypothetical protein [Elizabethkingia sp. HX WHF]MDX8564692.1 hypothetical protein [Elizabethkingia sp. HX WHF]
MAKVGTERIFHKGSGKEIYTAINFYTKTKKFVAVGMPDEIKAYYGTKMDRENPHRSYHHSGEISSESYEGCVKLANKIFTEFYEQRITETKIIAYKVRFNNEEKKNIFHAPAMALGIEYVVLYRIMIGEEAFISTSTYEESKAPDIGTRLGGPRMHIENGSNGYYDWEKVPYTEDIHEFFKSVENGLSAMIDKVNSFFGVNADTFIENLNSGKLLN